MFTTTKTTVIKRPERCSFNLFFSHSSLSLSFVHPDAGLCFSRLLILHYECVVLYINAIHTTTAMNSITKDAFFSVNYHGFFFFSFFLFFFALIFIIKFELTIFLKFSINGNFPCSFRKNYYLRNISLNFFKFFST